MYLPLISIIVPLYNKEQTISRCINSILTQDYENLEIIIIDDGSTDNGVEVVQSYKDSRVRYIYKENGGVSSARNLGLDRFKGEWAIFIDADDYFMPCALKTLLGLATRKKAKIATGNLFLENQGVRTPMCVSWRQRLVSNNFRALYFKTSVPSPGNVLFHKSVLEGCRFNEQLARYEDTAFILDILRHYKVAYTPEIIMVYALDYNFASRVYSCPERDFIMHMSFHNKPFWEKMVLASLLNEGLAIYGNIAMKEDYKLYAKYLYIDCKIRRFKKWLRFLYKTNLFHISN